MSDIFNFLPPIMAGYLRALQNRQAAIEMARDYLEYDDDTRADILAFYESGGPEIIEAIRESDE